METTNGWPELKVWSAQPRSGMNDLTKTKNFRVSENSSGSRKIAKPHLTNGLKGLGKQAETPNLVGLNFLASTQK